MDLFLVCSCVQTHALPLRRLRGHRRANCSAHQRGWERQRVDRGRALLPRPPQKLPLRPVFNAVSEVDSLSASMSQGHAIVGTSSSTSRLQQLQACAWVAPGRRRACRGKKHVVSGLAARKVRQDPAMPLGSMYRKRFLLAQRSAEASSGRKAVASVARGAGMHTEMKSFGKLAPGPLVLARLMHIYVVCVHIHTHTHIYIYIYIYVHMFYIYI